MKQGKTVCISTTFQTRHAEWGTVPHFSFNTGFSFYYDSQPVNSDTDTAHRSLLIIFCLFSDNATTPFPTLLYLLPPLSPPILSRSAVSGPGRFAGGGDSQGGGGWSIQKPLHLWSHSETPRPPRSICHRAECQEVSLGLTSSHSSTWHSERKRRKKEGERGSRERGRDGEKRASSRGGMNLTKALKHIRPTQQSQGDGGGRLSAPLISQMPPLWQCDTDY